MENQIVTSKQFTIDWRDAGKGFLIAAITGAFTVITESLDAGTLHFDWKNIGIASLTAGIAYLAKNFFTKSEVKTPA